MGIRRRWKRTDLFLVRVWRGVGNEGASGLTGTATVSDEDQAVHSAGQEWHGLVQRVANGESRQFANLGALLRALTVMLDGSGADDTNSDSFLEN